MQRAMRHTFTFLVLVLASCAIAPAAAGLPDKSTEAETGANRIRGEEHYVMRDGLRIYLWEKHKAGLERTFANNGKVALLVHGGTWPGRPDFDLQIRDYSLMDFLANHAYDVWSIDLHGYGRSDKTDKDWTDSHSAAADIAVAVGYITRLRGVTKINLLGWSAGTQRAGVFTMENPDKVAKLILYAPWWKGNAELNEFRRKRIVDNLGAYSIPSETGLLISSGYGRQFLVLAQSANGRVRLRPMNTPQHEISLDRDLHRSAKQDRQGSSAYRLLPPPAA